MIDTADKVRPTRMTFFFLCCYLVTQVYTLPILTIGPWAMWPSLPDVAFIGLAVAWIVSPAAVEPLSGHKKKILVAFTLLTAIACMSYLVSTVLAFNLNSRTFGANRGLGFGFYECIRMVQFLLIVRIVVSIPLPRSRMMLLQRVITVVAWVVCVSVILTYFEIVTTAQLAPHVPVDRDAAGAWWHYTNNFNHYGLGAISYTHAAVATHILMLVGMSVHLRGERHVYGNIALLSAGVLATFLTGSRAGFAVMLLVFGAYVLMRSPRWLINAGLGTAAIGLAVFLFISSQPPAPGNEQDSFSSLLARQSAAFKPFESDNLVGRDEIWSGRIESLNEEPIRWLIGWGFGSSPDTGPGLSPHMMPLQIIVELGLWVLVLVAFWIAWMLDLFWKAGGRDRIMFWTTIALFLSSATQETFYPVPSTGGFLGLFMIMAIVTIAPLSTEEPNSVFAGDQAKVLTPKALAPVH